jgi:hypothetical protein
MSGFDAAHARDAHDHCELLAVIAAEDANWDSGPLVGFSLISF